MKSLKDLINKLNSRSDYLRSINGKQMDKNDLEFLKKRPYLHENEDQAKKEIKNPIAFSFHEKLANDLFDFFI